MSDVNWDHLSGVFFDLETMATNMDACIMSIGAVRFDIGKNVIDQPFKMNLKVKEGVQKFGLRVRQDTIDWWKKQPKEIFQRQIENAVSYEEGITEFYKYVERMKPRRVWAWGSHFDVPIFETSIERVMGIKTRTPWNYWDVCDARTIFTCFGGERDDSSHDALEDAEFSARYLIDFFRSLSNE